VTADPSATPVRDDQDQPGPARQDVAAVRLGFINGHASMRKDTSAAGRRRLRVDGSSGPVAGRDLIGNG
jgi:hypothetical protein